MDECDQRPPGRDCQCDPGCVAYGDCCKDALKVCLGVWTTIAEGVTFADAGNVSDQGAASSADRGLEDDNKNSVSTTKAATTTSAAKAHSHDKKRRRHEQASAGSKDGNAIAEAEAPNGSAPADVEAPFCCSASASKDDVCGTCWPSARLEAAGDNYCAPSRERCEDCGKVWCGQGEATPLEAGSKNDSSGNGSENSSGNGSEQRELLGSGNGIVMKSLVRPGMRGRATAKASSHAPLAAALAVAATGLAALVLLARGRGARLLPRYEQLGPSAERASQQPLMAPASAGLAGAACAADRAGAEPPR